MYEYRITENPKGEFRVFKKKWWGWKVYAHCNFLTGFETHLRVFKSHVEAQAWLDIRMKKDKELEEFSPRHWYYGDFHGY